MNSLMYVYIASVFLFCRSGMLPRPLSWLPDLLALVVLLMVVLRLARHEPFIFPRKYIYLIVCYMSFLFIAVVLNSSSLKDIILGMRIYFKQIPLFLLPAVYDFNDHEIKKQIKLVLFLLIIQLPTAFVQKIYFSAKGIDTGDAVRGTLDDSGALSIVLIAAAAMVYSLYLRKWISRQQLGLLLVAFLLPTTINETKISVILLPMALLIPALLSEEHLTARRRKNIMMTLMIAAVFLGAFIPIYNIIIRPIEGAPDFVGLMQEKGYLESYLYKGVRGRSYEDVRRFDSVALAFKNVSHDGLALAFGMGIGTVSESIIDAPDNPFFKRAKQHGAQMTVVTQMLYETGILGLMVYLSFFGFIWWDIRGLSKSKGLVGALGLGWLAVVPIFVSCLVYTNLLHANVINLMFWYLCGLLVAKSKMITLRNIYIRTVMRPKEDLALLPGSCKGVGLCRQSRRSSSEGGGADLVSSSGSPGEWVAG